MSRPLPELPAAVELEVLAFVDRQNVAIEAFVKEHPRHRKDLAGAMLGQALAFCDELGMDADGFLKHVRERQAKGEMKKVPVHD